MDFEEFPESCAVEITFKLLSSNSTFTSELNPLTDKLKSFLAPIVNL